MNSVFSLSALNPLWWSHAKTCSKPDRASWEAARKVPPVVKMDPSSTYMLRDRCCQDREISFKRGEVKIVEMIGDRGEPCGILWSRRMGLDEKPLKDRRTSRLCRKEDSLA
jgi:hypothetical protein